MSQRTITRGSGRDMPVITAYGPFSNRLTGPGVSVWSSYGSADCDLIIPSGFYFKIWRLTMHSGLTAAYTITGKLHQGALDKSGSFGTLQLTATTVDANTEASPNTPPFLIDASSARQRLSFQFTGGAGSGTNANVCATIYGELVPTTSL